MKINKKIIAYFLAITVFLSMSGASCNLFGNNSGTNSSLTKVNLTIWRLFDDKEVFDPIVQSYMSARSSKVNITVNYVKKDYSEYIDNAVNALAAKKGPDILMLRNDWLVKQYDKLVPAPKTILTLDQLKSRFPNVVVNDVSNSNGDIYGIPFSMDTLVLYYNKDMFKARAKQYEDVKNYDYARKNFENPPLDWTSLINVSKELTIKNGNNIERAGIAMGTANNVDKAQDILSVIMLQNGTKMLSDDFQNANFNLSVKKDTGELYYPGSKALDFYTAFANPSTDWYTWNKDMPNSVDAFAQGKAAMLINYPYLVGTFAKNNPNLNYGVAPLPQIYGADKSVDYASYWVETVTNNSQNPEWAWDFLNYVSQNSVSSYLSATKRAGVVKVADSEVPLIRNRLDGNPLVFQQATAQTWYKGYYPNEIDSVINGMIDNVAISKQNTQNAIDKAASDVTSLLLKRPY